MVKINEKQEDHGQRLTGAQTPCTAAGPPPLYIEQRPPRNLQGLRSCPNNRSPLHSTHSLRKKESTERRSHGEEWPRLRRPPPLHPCWSEGQGRLRLRPGEHGGPGCRVLCGGRGEPGRSGGGGQARLRPGRHGGSGCLVPRGRVWRAESAARLCFRPSTRAAASCASAVWRSRPKPAASAISTTAAPEVSVVEAPTLRPCAEASHHPPCRFLRLKLNLVVTHSC